MLFFDFCVCLGFGVYLFVVLFVVFGCCLVGVWSELWVGVVGCVYQFGG